MVDSALQQDRIFDLENRSLNRDNCLYGFWALREALAKVGVILKTDDLHSPETCDIILFNERPKASLESSLREKGLLKKSVLMIFESALIRPDNWDLDFHKEVALVLTWGSDLLSRAKPAGNGLPAEVARYKRGGFTHKFPQSILAPSDHENSPRKLVTLIAGNKSVASPIELYSARREAISWFEKHAPESFTYYGVGWDHFYLKGGFGTKVLRKLGLLPFLPKHTSRCYGGKVESKLETLRQFDFSICFENAEKIPGYISEKIFDSFFAGCIPVYWGAPDIKEYIPKETFIDFREFQDYEKLFRFLKDMTPTRKTEIRNSIELFLKSEQAGIFNADVASKHIAKAVLSSIGEAPGVASDVGRLL